ncbi:hypothetical protein HAX54_038756 [Datura stramonium]|uniref:Uncharacterized protein n=1 Tax=Datura stramonium TaxID=4076 RepID=A0ABS8VN01_DATST|nr:hypothetical protein [Datura stramonium]
MGNTMHQAPHCGARSAYGAARCRLRVPRWATRHRPRVLSRQTKLSVAPPNVLYGHNIAPLSVWIYLRVIQVISQMCLRDAVFYYAVGLAPFEFFLATLALLSLK